MTDRVDLDTYRDFVGPLPKFAGLASLLVAKLGIDRPPGARGRPSSEDGISGRVIRDYGRRGVLSPTLTNPETGRGGLYGYRHLLELLAARVLLADGWTLDLIAGHLPGLDDRGLLALIPGQPEENRALALARQLRFEAALDAQLLDVDACVHMSQYPTPVQLDPLPSLATRARLRAELPAILLAIGADRETPGRRDVLCIEIASWLTVLIDRDRLRRLTAADAEAIGRAVAAALIDPPEPRSAPPTPTPSPRDQGKDPR